MQCPFKYAIFNVKLTNGTTHTCTFTRQYNRHIHGFSIHSWSRPPKNLENWRNKRFISFKTHAKWERAVTWWNPAAETRPVLYSPYFVPVPTLPRRLATILLLAFSLFKLVAMLSQCLCLESNKKDGYVSEYPQYAKIIFNKQNFLFTGYVHSMIFIVKCVTITCFFITYAALWWKSMIFIVLSSLETVHDAVQYRYCTFLLLNRLLRIRLKHQNPLLSYIQDREREKVHCKCTL